MLKNLLVIAFRNMRRQRLYSVLNILGLSLGLACSLLIVLYVMDELSYDRFHEKANQIYRVNQTNIWVDTDVPFGSTGPGVAIALEEDIPELEAVTRIHTPGEAWTRYTAPNGSLKSFNEEGVMAADSNFFDVFSFSLLKGDPSVVLKAPNSVLMTEETASKYFGEDEPVGKILTLGWGENSETFVVSGILADIPDNSHIDFDIMVSMISFPRVRRQSWTWIWTTFVTYVVVNPGADIAFLEDKVSQLPPKYAGTTLERIMGYSYEEFEKQGKTWELFLQPLTDIHLYSGQMGNRLGVTSDITYVYLFGAIAVLILLLSAINFMNLATARSARRAREVGIRKVLGSFRKQLVFQFLGEAVLYSMISMVIAFVLTDLMLSPFNQLSGKSLSLGLTTPPSILIGMLSISLVLGILSGLYPAFYLTAFPPATVLKGKSLPGGRSSGLRNTLVTLQFAISIGLMIGTGLVYQQLTYTREKAFGFDKENLIILQNAEKLGDQIDAFQQHLRTIPEVKNVAISDVSPPFVFNQDYFQPLNGKETELPLSYITVDEYYVETLGIEIISGRSFSKEFGRDSLSVVINESAARAMGWKKPSDSLSTEVVGQRLTYVGENGGPYEVIGVMKDFNFWSLHSEIEPLVLFSQNSNIFQLSNRFLTLRVQPTSTSSKSLTGLISDLESKWNEFSPELPFAYSFLDQDFFSLFETEQKMGKVLSIFTILAIFIACLGLFGLTAFTVEQRTQEVGIRKVLGASSWQIVRMLSLEFIRWIGIAFLVAVPVSAWMMDQWLERFPYRISLEIGLFLTVGVSAFAIAIATVSYHALQAANLDPVSALRDE